MESSSRSRCDVAACKWTPVVARLASSRALRSSRSARRVSVAASDARVSASAPARPPPASRMACNWSSRSVQFARAAMQCRLRAVASASCQGAERMRVVACNASMSALAWAMVFLRVPPSGRIDAVQWRPDFDGVELLRRADRPDLGAWCCTDVTGRWHVFETAGEPQGFFNATSLDR